MAQGWGWLLLAAGLDGPRAVKICIEKPVKLIDVSLGTELNSSPICKIYTESPWDVPALLHTHTFCDWNIQRSEILPEM